MITQEKYAARVSFREAHDTAMNLLHMRLQISRRFGERHFPFESTEAYAEMKGIMRYHFPHNLDEMDLWEFIADLFGDTIEEADDPNATPASVEAKRAAKRKALTKTPTDLPLQFIAGHVFSVFPSRHAQSSSTCKLCGNWYTVTCDPSYIRFSRKGIPKPCDVDSRLRAFVMQYAREHGKSWKSQLRKEWDSSCDELVLRARDIIGPSRLRKLELAWLEE